MSIKPYCFSVPSKVNKNLPDNWCSNCRNFVLCQEACANHPLKFLTLNLKKKYFNEIKEGVKTEEYREATYFWLKRIIDRMPFDVIEICEGYPESGDIDRRLFFRWIGLKREKTTWINDKKLMACDTLIIPLHERLDYPYQVRECRAENPADL